MSWLIPTALTSPGFWDFFHPKRITKGINQWVGPVEAIVALAYKRFRPGAKLKITTFQITNDHSHAIQWGEYNFDFQSIKRSILGGKSADMFNLKNPIFYSFYLINLLPNEKARILLDLTLQSVENMINGIYATDQVALECLYTIREILNNSINILKKRAVTNSDDDDDLEEEELSMEDLEQKYRISRDYLNNPLTKKSIALWKTHLSWLEDICNELLIAYDKNKKGEDCEINLKNVRVILEKVREEMEYFYSTIMEGK